MSSNLVIDKDGISSPETSEIRDAFVSAFISAFGSELNTDSSTPQGALIDELTSIKQANNSALLYALNQFNPEVAEGIWQEALAKIYFIERKKASRTELYCLITGTPGALIKDVVFDDLEKNIFHSEGEVVLGSDGHGFLYFYAEKEGAIDCYGIRSFLTRVVGLESIIIKTTKIGNDEETRKNFENRIKDTTALASTGSVASVKSAIIDLNGILDCRVEENNTGVAKTVKGVSIPAHSVFVCVDGIEEESGGASDRDIADALHSNLSAGCGTCNYNNSGKKEYNYIDEYTGISYKYLWNEATKVAVNFKVTVSDNLSEDTKEKIRKAIVEDFNGLGESPRVGIGETVYANRFCRPVDDLGVNIVSMKVKKGSSGTFADKAEFNLYERGSVDTYNVEVVKE